VESATTRQEVALAGAAIAGFSTSGLTLDPVSGPDPLYVLEDGSEVSCDGAPQTQPSDGPSSTFRGRAAILPARLLFCTVIRDGGIGLDPPHVGRVGLGGWDVGVSQRPRQLGSFSRRCPCPFRCARGSLGRTFRQPGDLIGSERPDVSLSRCLHRRLSEPFGQLGRPDGIPPCHLKIGGRHWLVEHGSMVDVGHVTRLSHSRQKLRAAG
jgi:hypothetical protein